MKRQYLGDSKDSFKWDYLDFLVHALGYRTLQLIWMMTPDDNGTDGSTAPERYPARSEVLRFCGLLRTNKDPGLLLELPASTGSGYLVNQYKPDVYIANNGRGDYFSGISSKDDRVVLLDPDNGFEPERRCSEKHVRYSDVERTVKATAPDSVVTVFQHHRRKKFSDDFTRIRERLCSGHATALCWHSLMFVSVSASEAVTRKVREVNHQYAKQRPVKVLA